MDYEKVIRRNLNHLTASIHCRWLLNRLRADDVPLYQGDALTVIDSAIFNEMIRGVLLVLEDNKKVANFWTLWRNEKVLAAAFSRKHRVEDAWLRDITKRLKSIRDQTHFHIDKHGIRKTREIWNIATINGDEFTRLLRLAWLFLQELAVARTGAEILMCDMDRAQFDRIIMDALERGHIPSEEFHILTRNRLDEALA